MRELYADKAKHSAATMRKILVSFFSHPRDHPTETQIQSIISSLTQKKKKEGLKAVRAEAVANAAIIH